MDTAGNSLLDLTDALVEADLAQPEHLGLSPGLPARDVPPAMVRLAQMVRTDPVFQMALREGKDPLTELAILLRQMAALIDQVSKRDG